MRVTVFMSVEGLCASILRCALFL